jgi:thiamine-monophosphate kinase
VPHDIVERVVSPASRVALARALAATGGVRAAIDLSDGLAGDLAHLCEASGVGARIHAASLPADQALQEAARALSALAGQERGPLPAVEGELLTRTSLGASDDYELLLSIEPAKWPDCERIARELGVPLTRVGEVLEARVLVLRSGSGAESWLEAPGWDHFTSGS